MKKLFTAIVVLTIAIVSVFYLSACSEVDVKEQIALLIQAEQDSHTDAEVFNITYENYEINEYAEGGENVVFYNSDSEENKYMVYNTVSATVIYSGRYPARILEFTDGEKWEEAFVVSRPGNVCDIYTRAGKIADDVEATIVATQTGGDFCVNSDYRNGSVLDLGDGRRLVRTSDGCHISGGEGNAIADFSFEELIQTESYNLYAYPDGKTFYILDKDSVSKGRTVTIEEITESVDSENSMSMVNILPEDKLVVQRIVKLPYNTTRGYDFYNDNGFYMIDTFIYDIAEDKTKKVKNFDFLITGGDYEKGDPYAELTVLQINKDKTIGNEVLQIFDSELDVAIDIQAILPGATSYETGAGLFVMKSGGRMVVYDKNGLLFDRPENKIDADDTYLLSSGILLADGGSTVYGADGKRIVNMIDTPEAHEYIMLEYAMKNIYYIDITASLNGDLRAYSRESGRDYRIGALSSKNFVMEGLAVLDSEEGVEIYDLRKGEVIREYNRYIDQIMPVKGGYLLIMNANFSAGINNKTYEFVKTAN